MDVLENGPARATVRVVAALPTCPGAVVEQKVSLAAGARRVEIRLYLRFPEAQALGDRNYPGGSQGPYVPGLFVAFPCSRQADLIVDKAYCLARDTLRCGRRETLFQIPFRHCTTTGLSLAAPDTAEFALLTHGLTDFFLVPEQRQQLLGLSLGTGVGPHGSKGAREQGSKGAEEGNRGREEPKEVPYQGEYVFEYALFLPTGKAALWEAYTQAQEAQIPLQGVVVGPGAGDLPDTASCFTTEDPSAPITGAQFRDGQLWVRFIDLAERRRTVTLRCPVDLADVTLAPPAEVPPTVGGTVRIDLPPRAVREIRARVVK
jgi:hypothetical protein